MHPPVSSLVRAGQGVGEGGGIGPLQSKGCGASEGEGGNCDRPDASEKQKEPQGRRKGRRLLGDGPSGQDGWAQGGAGVERGGIKTGQDDVENFI